MAGIFMHAKSCQMEGIIGVIGRPVLVDAMHESINFLILWGSSCIQCLSLVPELYITEILHLKDAFQLCVDLYIYIYIYAVKKQVVILKIHLIYIYQQIMS